MESTKTVQATFTLTFTEEQYKHAVSYVEDMKAHPQRVYWQGKANKSDEELVFEYIADRILSGYYRSFSPSSTHAVIQKRAAR